MRRTSYEQMNCSIASALDVVGEPWTLLIVRDAFYGVRRFDDFQENLGIARNVLTARLKKLVEAGVFRKTAYRQRPLRHEYRLTDKGAALFTVIVGLKQWGDRFGVASRNGKPMELVDRSDSSPLDPVLIDAPERPPARAHQCARRGRTRRRPGDARFLRSPGDRPSDAALRLVGLVGQESLVVERPAAARRRILVGGSSAPWCGQSAVGSPRPRAHALAAPCPCAHVSG